MDIKNKNLIKELSEPLNPTKNTEISSDINGSYTGNPENGEKPLQDADDL